MTKKDAVKLVKTALASGKSEEEIVDLMRKTGFTSHQTATVMHEAKGLKLKDYHETPSETLEKKKPWTFEPWSILFGRSVNLPVQKIGPFGYSAGEPWSFSQHEGTNMGVILIVIVIFIVFIFIAFFVH